MYQIYYYNKRNTPKKVRAHMYKMTNAIDTLSDFVLKHILEHMTFHLSIYWGHSVQHLDVQFPWQPTPHKGHTYITKARQAKLHML